MLLMIVSNKRKAIASSHVLWIWCALMSTVHSATTSLWSEQELATACGELYYPPSVLYCGFNWKLLISHYTQYKYRITLFLLFLVSTTSLLILTPFLGRSFFAVQKFSWFSSLFSSCNVFSTRSLYRHVLAGDFIKRKYNQVWGMRTTVYVRLDVLITVYIRKTHRLLLDECIIKGRSNDKMTGLCWLCNVTFNIKDMP